MHFRFGSRSFWTRVTQLEHNSIFDMPSIGWRNRTKEREEEGRGGEDDVILRTAAAAAATTAAAVH